MLHFFFEREFGGGAVTDQRNDSLQVYLGKSIIGLLIGAWVAYAPAFRESPAQREGGLMKASYLEFNGHPTGSYYITESPALLSFISCCLDNFQKGPPDSI